MKNQIVCIHLLNNFSGSPHVLSTVISGLYSKYYHVTLVTSFNNKGFLSETKCAEKINISYVFKKNRFLRMIQFAKFQLFAALFILKTDRNTLIYINTIQPFLPAIVAKIFRHKVIYHFHEANARKSLYIRFLFYIVQITSDKIICVSDYVRDRLNSKSIGRSYVIYNSLTPEFYENQISKITGRTRKSIIMVCSAREYKGIFDFCKLSLILKEYDFVLVCDTSKIEIAELFKNYSTIPNLRTYETQTNLHPFYASADLVMNLSNPHRFIETFGLTILEGMSYGLPAIVPPIGGIAELVQDNYNGFKADVNEINYLITCIKTILENESNYARMSLNAKKKAREFNPEKLVTNIEILINSF